MFEFVVLVWAMQASVAKLAVPVRKFRPEPPAGERKGVRPSVRPIEAEMLRKEVQHWPAEVPSVNGDLGTIAGLG